MKTMKVFLISMVSISLLMSFTLPLKTWEILGKRQVNYKLDRDEIMVTARDGAFTKLKLQVKRAPVEFKKVVVHFKNGSKQEIVLRDQIRAGGESRVIDLEGQKRIIQKVVFYYNSKLRSTRKPVVTLWGRH